MKEACVLGKTTDTQRFGCGAMIKCLLFMLAVLSVLNPAMLPPYGLENERTSKWPSSGEERHPFDPMNSDLGGDVRHLMKLAADFQTDESVLGKEKLEDIKQENENIESTDTDTSTPPLEENDKSDPANSFVESEKPAESNSFAERGTTQPTVTSNQGQEEVPSDAESSTTETSGSYSSDGQDQAASNSDNSAQNPSVICDFTDYRHNACSIAVNLKVMGSSANVLLMPSPSTTPPDTTIRKIRPFTRKWEDVTMSRVREVTIQWASDQNQGPECDVTHDMPVLIFATAGFPFNPFHAYTDLLIPIFIAANRYNGKVQFAVTNFHWPWIDIYMKYLQALSPYPIINLDSETKVHCFPFGQVGLKGTKPLTVDNSVVEDGSTMLDFKQFVRTSLSLERAQVKIIERNSNKKPKIAILLRKGTRTFTNEDEIIKMAEGVGFEVVRADTDTTRKFPRIAHLINSCDVLMGLHGAGLTNMIYLPENATVIQIIPWGNLKFISWKDYGEPTKDMGLKYVEYEIKIEESTLIEKYPRNHTVFTNPDELHKQGWDQMYNVYLVEQSVKLDVNRFRGVLEDIINSLITQQQRRK